MLSRRPCLWLAQERTTLLSTELERIRRHNSLVQRCYIVKTRLEELREYSEHLIQIMENHGLRIPDMAPSTIQDPLSDMPSEEDDSTPEPEDGLQSKGKGKAKVPSGDEIDSGSMPAAAQAEAHAENNPDDDMIAAAVSISWTSASTHPILVNSFTNISFCFTPLGSRNPE
ncbi:MAG: hypothetical protein Q9166_000339 [cf. Caloplaca sp. 2 TL-2023]